jgi:hypothetical protein
MVMQRPKVTGHQQGTIWGRQTKKACVFTQAFEIMARPRGFEPLTSASRGHYTKVFWQGVNRFNLMWFRQLDVAKDLLENPF